ncbi:putative multi-drug efflux MFS permease [Rhodococcus triatomae BKS 15-14]|nr:putative multi-drug efflux MFS permease [Rhodococcus triatomae BKS 15-14]
MAASAPGRASLSSTERLLIGLLVVGTFVVILNETIMGVALPRLMADLEITAATAQWLTTAFLLTMAIVIPATGYLLQRFSTRTIFVTAMTLFSVGTLVAAIAPGFELLLVGRVVQAGGTAMMMPLLTTTILNLVPPQSRGRIMGTMSIVIAVAPAIGPTVSGLILRVTSWRWIFGLVLPIALVVLALGAVLIKNVTVPRKVPFDLLSLLLSAAAFGGLVYGLSSIGESASGHTPVTPWIPISVGVIALAVFVARQFVLQREDRALLDLRTFGSKPFSIAVVVLIVAMMALFGSLIVLPLYLQNVLGLDTLATGLLMLPGGIAMGVLSPIVGRLYDRVGPRPLVVPGTVLVSAALWLMTMLDVDTSRSMVVGIHVVLMVGLAFVFTPLFTSSLGSLPPKLYTHGSAIVSTLQQVAGAAGTALFIAVMTTWTTSDLAEGAAQLDATMTGIHAAFLCGGALSLIAVAASLFVRPAPPSQPEFRSPPHVAEGALRPVDPNEGPLQPVAGAGSAVGARPISGRG